MAVYKLKVHKGRFSKIFAFNSKQDRDTAYSALSFAKPKSLVEKIIQKHDDRYLGGEVEQENKEN